MLQKQDTSRTVVRLSKPYFGQKQNLLELIEDIVESGFLTQGKYVAQFEQQVAEYLGVRYGVAVSSGTAALHLSVIALGIGPGDEVVVPAYTFPATANVVELAGAKPVPVDVDLDTYTIDVQEIEKVLSPRTKAIIPVHLFGSPADMDPLIDIARSHGLAIIEDAAGALGSEYRGRKCGTIGRLGCLSFHPRKIITTGEGGMVVTNDGRLAELIRLLRNHGLQMSGGSSDCDTPGFNYRMNELQAALGINQMCEIERIIAEREALARSYVASLGNVSDIAFQQTLRGCSSVWQAFVMRLKTATRDSILAPLRKAGIEVHMGTYAIHMLHFYSAKYGGWSDYPRATELYRNTLAVPFYNGMAPEVVNVVGDSLRRVMHDGKAT